MRTSVGTLFLADAIACPCTGANIYSLCTVYVCVIEDVHSAVVLTRFVHLFYTSFKYLHVHDIVIRYVRCNITNVTVNY